MKNILLFFVIIAFILSIVLWVRHGGGEAYPDLTTAAVLSGTELEEVLSYPEPVGNVAVSRNGRIFFTVHPEARPEGNRLLEYVEGAAVPYPDLTSQLDLFDTVLGVAIAFSDWNLSSTDPPEFVGLGNIERMLDTAPYWNALTNMLIFGVLMFSPIVVPIEQFPDGLAAAHRILPLSLTFDHRAVTGGEAARFMAAVISKLTD